MPMIIEVTSFLHENSWNLVKIVKNPIIESNEIWMKVLVYKSSAGPFRHPVIEQLGDREVDEAEPE